MHTKRTSKAMLTSVAIHLLLVLIAGLYFVTHTQTFKNFIGVDVFNHTRTQAATSPKTRLSNLSMNRLQ